MTVSSLNTAESYTHRQILVVFSGLMTGLFLAALDQTIVATALPTIVGTLGGLDYYSWVVTIYLLSSTVCTPLYGKISDLYGRRTIFQVAILIFLVGSLLAGLAQSMLQLIVFRGVQGVGAAGLITMTFAIVGDVVSPRERGRYIGLLAAIWALASILGPLIGGLIVDNTSWRWIFLINIPVGATALFVISNVLRLPVVKRLHRIDIEGLLLLVIAVSCLFLALVWGGTEHAWNSPVIVSLILSGAAFTTIFLLWESKAAEPMLPLYLFHDSLIFLNSGLSFIIGCALFVSVVFIPLFLQIVTGVSATNSGLLLLPLTAGIVTGSVTSGRMISHTGRYRIWPIGGMAITTTGMYLMSLMQTDTPQIISAGYMLWLGLGIGSVMQVTLLIVQNAVEHRNLGVATSTAQFFRLMGGSFGVAIFGTIVNTRLATELPRQIPAEYLALTGSEISKLLGSPATIRMLPPLVVTGIAESLELAIRSVFLLAVPLMALGFILAWFIKEVPLRETVGSTSPNSNKN